jgi:hypothetical protein
MSLKRIYFAFFLFLSCGLFSQAPGYLGKRTVGGYGLNTSPVTFGTTFRNKTWLGEDGTSTPSGISFNLLHEAYIERAFTTNFMGGMSLKLFQTAHDNRETIRSLGKPTAYYKIRGMSFQPYFKIYPTQYVAPWGSYILLGPSINAFMTSYDAYMYVPGNINGHDTLYSDFGKRNKLHTGWDILFGVGKNRMISGKYTIDYGFNFQVYSFLSGLEAFDYGLLDNLKAPLNQANYIDQTSRERVRGLNRFNIYIRFGWLW